MSLAVYSGQAYSEYPLARKFDTAYLPSMHLSTESEFRGSYLALFNDWGASGFTLGLRHPHGESPQI